LIVIPVCSYSERMPVNFKTHPDDIETVRINSFDHILEEIKSSYDPLFPSDKFWWRGQVDSAWNLLPKALRAEKRSDDNAFEHKLEADRYISIFKSKARTRLGLLQTNIQPNNNVEWVSVAQHHGLPTWLLDWSESSLTGLFFAVSSIGNGNNLEEKDAALWRIDPRQLNAQNTISDVLYAYSKEVTDLINELSQTQWASKQNIAEKGKIYAVALDEIASRMLVQAAKFTLHDSDIPLNKRDYSSGLCLKSGN